MRSTILSLALLMLLAAGCSHEQMTDSGREKSSSNPRVIETEVAAAHPVSLQALSDKTFDGRDLVLGRVLDDNAFYTRYYITYRSGELMISGIMNIPKTAVPEGGFPVLFLNHGYIDPAVYTNGRGLRREQDYLAKQGFVVVHSDYRNHAQSDKDPDSEYNFRLGYTEDVINAVLAVQNSDLKNINRTKIGMLGHSMGGGVTQNILAVKPELVRAAVLYAPVSGRAGDSFERWTKSRPEIASEIEQRFGSPTSSPEFWQNLSAETYFEKYLAPVVYFHGTRDQDVPFDWSVRSVEALKALNKPAELVEYTGQPHEFTSPAWERFMEHSSEFFRTNL
jgi:dipeptidyl aminopeptidase/acylaminoacyl peptidase